MEIASGQYEGRNDMGSQELAATHRRQGSECRVVIVRLTEAPYRS